MVVKELVLNQRPLNMESPLIIDLNPLYMIILIHPIEVFITREVMIRGEVMVVLPGPLIIPVITLP